MTYRVLIYVGESTGLLSPLKPLWGVSREEALRFVSFGSGGYCFTEARKGQERVTLIPMARIQRVVMEPETE